MVQKTATSKEKHKDSIFIISTLRAFMFYYFNVESCMMECSSKQWSQLSSNVKSGHAMAEPHKHSTDWVLSGDSGTHLTHSK